MKTNGYVASDGFTIPLVVLGQIQNHASACLPEEACGFLAGNRQTATIALPVTNALHSATEFRMEPTEQLLNMIRIEELGYEMIAIYHSHPNGPATPSETDIKSHAYPGVFSVILSLQNQQWYCRVFDIQSDGYTEIPLSSG